MVFSGDAHFDYDSSAGTISLVAGSIRTADFAAEAVVDKLTADLTGNSVKLAALKALLQIGIQTNGLANQTTRPATHDYDDYAVINYRGRLLQKIPAGGDSYVIKGTAAHPSSTFFIGADNVDDGVTYGEIDGDIVASIEWATQTAENVDKVIVRLPVASASAPATLWVETYGPRGRTSLQQLTRNSQYDETDDPDGDVIGWGSGTDAERVDIAAGERFEFRFWRDYSLQQGLSNPFAIHEADRWEDYIVRAIGVGDDPNRSPHPIPHHGGHQPAAAKRLLERPAGQAGRPPKLR